MTPEQLLADVARALGITLVQLRSRSRTRFVAQARQAACWVLHEAFPRLSQTSIGDLLGGIDHTTVKYAIDKTTLRLAADPALFFQLHSLLPQRPLAQPARQRPDHAMRWWVAQSRDSFFVRAA